jgi:hypothetical protein
VDLVTIRPSLDRFDCGNDGLDQRVVVLLKRSVNGIHSRLEVSSVFRSISGIFFGDEDRRTNRTLGMIVFNGDSISTQQCRHVPLISAKQFVQFFCLSVGRLHSDQLLHAMFKSAATTCEHVAFLFFTVFQ